MSWNTAILNRSFGLDLDKNDAYVTGYFYGMFDMGYSKVYSNIYQTIKDMYGDCKYVDGANDIPYVLAAFLTGAPTMPTGTLNADTIQAMGGTKWGVASNIDYGDTFTLHFVEMSGLPIFKIISSWFNLIRDRNSGRSRLKKYGKEYFSAQFIYATTKPNGSEIEQAMRFEGCYPLKDPMDLIASDVGTVGQLGMDIDFHFDRVWVDNSARAKAEEMLNRINKFDKYSTDGQGHDPKTVYKQI